MISPPASDGPTGLVGYGLQYGVQCSECAAEQLRTDARHWKQALPEFADAVLSLLPQTPFVFDDCASWDVPPAAPALFAPVHSDVPVLLGGH